MMAALLHGQNDAQAQPDGMERYLSDLGFSHHALFTGSLVRRDGLCRWKTGRECSTADSFTAPEIQTGQILKQPDVVVKTKNKRK